MLVEYEALEVLNSTRMLAHLHHCDLILKHRLNNATRWVREAKLLNGHLLASFFGSSEIYSSSAALGEIYDT